MNDDFLNDLWTESKEDALDIDWNQLHNDGAAFRRLIRRRNLVEMFAAGVVVVFFGSAAWTGTDLLMRLSELAVAIGALVVARNLVKRGDAPEPKPATSTTDYVRARRDELIYQAELLESVLGWYIGPLLPGLVGIAVATAVGAGLGAAIPMMVVSGGMLVAVWQLNRKAARGLRKEADELPDLGPAE